MLWKVATLYSFKTSSWGVNSKRWQLRMESCFPEQLELCSSHVIQTLVWDYLIHSVTARRLYPGTRVCLTWHFLTMEALLNMMSHMISDPCYSTTQASRRNVQHHGQLFLSLLSAAPISYSPSSPFLPPPPTSSSSPLVQKSLPQYYCPFLLSSLLILSIFSLHLTFLTSYFAHHRGVGGAKKEMVTRNTSGWMLEPNGAKSLTGNSSNLKPHVVAAMSNRFSVMLTNRTWWVGKS